MYLQKLIIHFIKVRYVSFLYFQSFNPIPKHLPMVGFWPLTKLISLQSEYKFNILIIAATNIIFCL